VFGGWKCDSSARAPAQQVQGLEFKPQNCKKEKEIKGSRNKCFNFKIVFRKPLLL
jgi:hypothetical protein